MPGINFQNKEIHYTVSGAGEGVLLLHGFGENGRVFEKQVAYLKDTYKVVVPDLPGSGKSKQLDGRPELSDFAEIISNIAEKEFPDQKFHLMGHSMGGYTTMAFVEKYADRLRTFGLLHSSAFGDTDEKKQSRRKAIDFIKKNGGHSFLKTIVPDLFSEESKKSHPEYVDELLALTDDIPDNVLIQYYEAMINRPDRSGLLVSSPVPVFFLIGKHDNAVSFEASMKQCHLPNISSVHILEHSGHMGMWEETDKTNGAILEFLRGPR